MAQKRMNHNWFPLCSDINSTPSETYYWWRCQNCGKDTEHLNSYQEISEEKPSEDGCQAKKKGSVFPLSSI
jgi:hypothetical protein